MSGVKREQGNDIGSQTVSRQDRNCFLSDGGFWSWNATTGRLEWSAQAVVRIGALAVSTLAAGFITGITTPNQGVYVTLDRASGGVLTAAKVMLPLGTNDNDDRFFIGVRGDDNRFYMTDGTVFSDGDYKRLGTVNSQTDRDSFLATPATTLYTLAFNYIVASNQLSVFVGGFLQALNIDYTEVGAGSSNQIDFVSGHEPSAGERITCLNIIGGQGPSGPVSDMQDAYNGGPDVSTTDGNPLSVYMADAEGDDDSTLVEMGSESTRDAFQVLKDGTVVTTRLRIMGTANHWDLVVADGKLVIAESESGVALQLYDDTEQGMEWGEWTGSVFQNGCGPLRWKEYAGTFVAGTPTVIATGLDHEKIKGVIVRLENPVTGLDQMLEMNVAASSTRAAFVSVEQTSGDVKISGDTAGTTAVGSNLQGHTYTAIVFFGE